jgi:hypothetical protein
MARGVYHDDRTRLQVEHVLATCPNGCSGTSWTWQRDCYSDISETIANGRPITIDVVPPDWRLQPFLATPLDNAARKIHDPAASMTALVESDS